MTGVKRLAMFALLACLGLSRLWAGIPFELNSNKIYLRAQVQDQGPHWFILDTGAVSNVVDTEVANSLGLPTSGNFEISGAGPGALPASIAKKVSLKIGDVSLASQEVEIIPINRAISFSEGRKVDGLLGCPFFQQFVVAIDYPNRQVEFYEPSKFHYPDEGEVVPFRIENGNIFIHAAVTLPDGTRSSEKFLVDTGWRSAVSFTEPFMRNHASLTTVPSVMATAGVGIGGAVTSAIGRIKALEIGRFVVKQPFAEFSADGKGLFAQEDLAGVIGGEILRRFKVVLDYSRNRMVLTPNKDFDVPYEFDMSGIYLAADERSPWKLKVFSVIQGSPASEAGLRAGDLIETIDDRPATEFTVERVRQMWKEEGREYRLSIRRGDATFQTAIKLRRLV